MKSKIFLISIALGTLMLCGCQQNNSEPSQNNSVPEQPAPSIPYSKGPTTSPSEMQGPQNPPSENSSNPPKSVTETEKVQISIPQTNP